VISIDRSYLLLARGGRAGRVARRAASGIECVQKSGRANYSIELVFAAIGVLKEINKDYKASSSMGKPSMAVWFGWFLVFASDQRAICASLVLLRLGGRNTHNR
jgi:hypothetical protein